MAEGLNRVLLIGNLGQDPELRFTQGGQAILRLRLATSESYVPKGSSERQTRTEWHSVTVWGNRAEALHKILAKGRTVGIEGRLQHRSWEDQAGQKRTSTEVVASNVLLLGGGGGGGGGSAGPSGGGSSYAGRGGAPDDSFGGGFGGGGDPQDGFPADSFNDDDIPF